MTLYQPHLKDIIQTIPHKPGVYRYYDNTDAILYIGKAKDLKKRVSSYFQESRIHNERLMLLLSRIDRIEYTIVDTEHEALILEANLIFSLQPPFNILLKNESSYVYVRKTNDPIKGYFLSRRNYDPQSVYFGPYTKKYAIEDIMRTLRIIFPYCQARFPQSKPCQYVSIKQCNGICVGQEDIHEYNARLQHIDDILAGKSDSAMQYLENAMSTAVKHEQYELAGLWRDKRELLKNTIQTQKIILPSKQSLDILTCVVRKDNTGLIICALHIQQIRDGKMIHILDYIVSGTFDEETENEHGIEHIFESCIMRFLSSYTQSAPILLQTYCDESIFQ